jgi:hypothetical protein
MATIIIIVVQGADLLPNESLRVSRSHGRSRRCGTPHVSTRPRHCRVNVSQTRRWAQGQARSGTCRYRVAAFGVSAALRSAIDWARAEAACRAAMVSFAAMSAARFQLRGSTVVVWRRATARKMRARCGAVSGRLGRGGSVGS